MRSDQLEFVLTGSQQHCGAGAWCFSFTQQELQEAGPGISGHCLEFVAFFLTYWMTLFEQTELYIILSSRIVLEDREPLIDPEQQTKPNLADPKEAEEATYDDLLAKQTKMCKMSKEVRFFGDSLGFFAVWVLPLFFLSDFIFVQLLITMLTCMAGKAQEGAWESRSKAQEGEWTEGKETPSKKTEEPDMKPMTQLSAAMEREAMEGSKGSKDGASGSGGDSSAPAASVAPEVPVAEPEKKVTPVKQRKRLLVTPNGKLIRSSFQPRKAAKVSEKEKEEQELSEAPVVKAKAKAKREAKKVETGGTKAPVEKPTGQPDKEDQKDKEGKKATAHDKRVAKAKLALQKLTAALPPCDAKDIGLPGHEFTKISWTVINEKPLSCSRINVVLYSESFYIYKPTIPDFLSGHFKVRLL